MVSEFMVCQIKLNRMSACQSADMVMFCPSSIHRAFPAVRVRLEGQGVVVVVATEGQQVRKGLHREQPNWAD